MDNNAQQQNPQQQFVKEYDELCKRTGCKIVGVPSFMPTNHGTFELAVELRVIPAQPQGPGLV
jgi:hypothetical protein